MDGGDEGAPEGDGGGDPQGTAHATDEGILRDPANGSLPAVVLLDLNLPGFSGLQTLAELKGDPALRRVPVVVLTTSKSQSEVDRCYELGAAAVLNKPLRLREYREMLRAFERFWLGHVRLPERT